MKENQYQYIKIKDYKKINRKLEENLNIRNDRLDKAINEFDEKMKTTKNIPFNKNQVIINVDTFDTIQKIIKESKKTIELQPKVNEVFNQINSYASGYKALEKENQKYKKEIDNLKIKNNKLIKENKNLMYQIAKILNSIKQFFRKLLQKGTEYIKDYAENEVKEYYDNYDFEMEDVKDIAKGTPREDSLFEYANVPDFYRTEREFSNYENEEKDKDDFDISL